MKGAYNNKINVLLVDDRPDKLLALQTVLQDLDINTEHAPIIFVTGVNITENHISKGYELGAVDYIFTPEVMRLAAENRLHEMESRMQKLFNTLNPGIYRMTPAGVLLEANPAFLRLLGVKTIAEANQTKTHKLEAISKSAFDCDKSRESKEHDQQLTRLGRQHYLGCRD